MVESAAVAVPEVGDFVAIRGKSWIVEASEVLGPVRQAASRLL